MADKIAEQTTEYGYRTPDGTEVWGHVVPGPIYAEGDLSTKKGQEKTRKRFKKHLRNSGLPEAWGELEFIQRVRTVTYSETIPLPAKDEDDDLDLGW